MNQRARITIGILIVLLLTVVLLRTRFDWPRTPGQGQPWSTLERPQIDSELPLLPISRVLGSENTFGWLLEVRVFDEETLLVIDRQPLVGEERLLAVDRETGLIKHRAAPFGEGPGEIRDVASIDSVPNRPGVFSLYDYNPKRLTILAYSPWTARPLGYLVHDDVGHTIQAEWLSETEVVMNGVFDGHLLRFYEANQSDHSLQLKSRKGSNLFPDAPASTRQFLNRNTLAVSPDREHIAVVFVKADLLYFFDPTGELVRMVRGPMDIAGGATAEDMTQMTQPPIAYQDATASQEHVFALYSGHSGDQQGNGDTIHVFSWDGELVAAYELERTIHFLTVDPEGRFVYGIAIEPFPQIVEYVIPDAPD